jgi:hypothetical protein
MEKILNILKGNKWAGILVTLINVDSLKLRRNGGNWIKKSEINHLIQEFETKKKAGK